MAKTEKRSFRMHHKLLYDVIFRQAGSLAKAILEAVMNSIDAKAKECRIELQAGQLLVQDDGQGLKHRTQVEKFFESFGEPHDPDEQKVYGTFRMGRGQLFSYGRNLWRTGRFQMDVDVKNKGLDYELQDGLEPAQGCRVEVTLYKPLLPSDLDETERTIAQWVKYAPIPVYWNGNQISQDPAAEKDWDHVTDDAYIRLKPTGSLAVYNLGVHVLDMPGYRLGTGGTVVSRKQLKVNFARNDVQSDCPVWLRLRPLVDQLASERVAKKTQLTDDERIRLAQRFMTDKLTNWYELPLFTAVTGRHFSYQQLATRVQRNPKLSVCDKDDQIGDRLFRQHTAFVFAKETLTRFRVASVDALLKLLRKHDEERTWQLEHATAVPFEQLSAGLQEHHDILPEKEWTSQERLWQKLLSSAKYAFRLCDEDKAPQWRRKNLPCQRQIVIGDSECSSAWTDGMTYVAMARQLLRSQSLTVAGFTTVGAILLHELCHGTSSATEHDHNQDFYEKFHDASTAGELGLFVAQCLSRLPTLMQSEGRRLTKRQLRDQDQLTKMQREATTVACAVGS